QSWGTTTARTTDDEEVKITASIDEQVKTITEAALRRHLKLEDSDGITSLSNTEIFKQLALMGDITRKAIEIPQSQFPTKTQVADEATFTSVDVDAGGVATIDISLDSDDEDDLEDPFKQGRKIAQIDEDEGITLVQIGAQTQGRSDEDLMYETGVKEQKTRKSIMAKPEKPLKKKDKFKSDENMALRLHAEEQAKFERLQKERVA
ncbi:hypothetical protein Tco_0930813, partial [Tanacetum coccineum]